MSFVRLRRGNDWGVDYLYHPARPKAFTYSRDSGIAFREGQPIRVRWPDGTVSSEVVRHQTRHAVVGDHGKDYPVTFQFPGFETAVRGVTTWLALDEVEVEVETSDAEPSSASEE